MIYPDFTSFCNALYAASPEEKASFFQDPETLLQMFNPIGNIATQLDQNGNNLLMLTVFNQTNPDVCKRPTNPL